MKLYWFTTDIPALQGLTRLQRKKAMRPVLPLVWRHWQAWLPMVLVPLTFVLFMMNGPDFPYRGQLAFIAAFVLGRIAMIPFLHYLNYYLNRSSSGTPAPTTTSR